MQHYRSLLAASNLSLLGAIGLAPLVPALVPGTNAAPSTGHVRASELQLRCLVDEDTLLQRRYSGGLELEFDGMSSSMNGQEVPQQYLPEIEMEISYGFEVEVEDHVLSAKDGQPRLFERSFETGRSQDARRFTMGGPFVEPVHDENSWESESMLEGQRVRFRWDEEVEAHEPELVDEQAPEFLSKGLGWDLDWRTLLPQDPDVEVEVGASWECVPEAGRALLLPCGDLHWTLPEYVDERDMRKPIGVVEGTLEARIGELNEEEGWALIELTGELETVHVRETDLEHIPVAEGEATETTTTTYDVEGRLIWDLAGNHPRSMKAEGSMKLTSVTEKTEGQPGGDFHSTMRLKGGWNLTMELERSEGDG